MATIKIGSARHDENGKYINGEAGDQLQTSSTDDTVGEVSMQKMYVHSKGWYIIRPKNIDYANKMATLMKKACNNANIGYDQNGRLGIISAGISTKNKTECDCSSLVREVVKEATGVDPGNFTTASELKMLIATGLFEDEVAYVSQAKTPVYNGDILVTKTKGHTVIVVSGNPRKEDADTDEEDKDVDESAVESASLSTTLQYAKKGPDSTYNRSYKTTAGLNLCYGPSSNKYAIIVTMPKGTKVRCYGYYSVTNNVKWLLIDVTIKGVKYTGFACSSYLKAA